MTLAPPPPPPRASSSLQIYNATPLRTLNETSLIDELDAELNIQSIK